MFVPFQQSEVAIVGASCRLPGASNRQAFGNLLDNGICAVTKAPKGRWSAERFLHSDPATAGFAYTFSGGYLDTPFDFDPSVFSMSPREAMEADPQQRLLLEVVHEALEDAWLTRSELAGKDVGVYVGASSLDHGTTLASDPAAIDRYFMTGNTLSVISNRLSHNFDWHGPSFTVDTACSSSLVALVQAVQDLVAGRIDTAVVAGVNILLNPLSFVGFSRASMLSPTGLCRPFSDKADGYVRGEGIVALVLRRAGAVVPGSARAWIAAAGINSDGRTSGIALPNAQSQARLISDLYQNAGISPDAVSFLEAHGTGTRAGDWAEAHAIGEALGQRRAKPIPVGSVKSNLGHLEPASGVAAVLKVLHAFETRRLPASLHLDVLNQDIDFEALGLAPARSAVDFSCEEMLIAGVSSFGFGGTNAHVVLRSNAMTTRDKKPDVSTIRPGKPPFLVISAATRDALIKSAQTHAEVLSAGTKPGLLAAAVATGRDVMAYRAVIPIEPEEGVLSALESFAETGRSDRVAEGLAPSSSTRLCFAFSGNGAQWVGMGRLAYTNNAAFRSRFQDIEALFADFSDRTLSTELFDDGLSAANLSSASFGQPLVYAVQSATAHALTATGLMPDMVVGHSVGEIAAAELAGKISTRDAVRIIIARAACQEAVYGQGRMAVLSASRQDVQQLIASLGSSTVEIAAENGPSSITITGAIEDVKQAVSAARRRRIAGRQLELDYPFHSTFLEPLRERLLSEIGELVPCPACMAMVSTVTGSLVDDQSLDAEYWWRNFREPVEFRRAIEQAGALGANVFVEIGPRPILQSAIAQTLREATITANVVSSLSQADDRTPDRDPIVTAAARLIANGARQIVADVAETVQKRVDRSIPLPHYAWQNRPFQFAQTSERLDVFGSRSPHPLIGTRFIDGSHEWRSLVDTTLVPYLADHVVDGEVVVPGSAFAEMMLAVARELTPEGTIGFEDLDIIQSMTLPKGIMRELRVSHTPATNVVEVKSRPRLGVDEWTLHARGRLITYASPPHAPTPLKSITHVAGDEHIYTLASAAGLDYGPRFHLAKAMRRNSTEMEIELEAAEADCGYYQRHQILHPASLDACFHPLFDVLDTDNSQKRTYLPIRFDRLRVFRDHAAITRAKVVVDRETDQSFTVSLLLMEDGGAVVAELDRALLKAVVLARRDTSSSLLESEWRQVSNLKVDFEGLVAKLSSARQDQGDAVLLLRAHMRSVAYRALAKLTAGLDAKGGNLDVDLLVEAGRLAVAAVPYASMLIEDLVTAGFVTALADGQLRLVEQTGLPSPERILATFAADFPGESAELMLAARTMAEIDRFLITGEAIAHRAPVLRQFEATGVLTRPALALLKQLVEAVLADAGAAQPRIAIAEPDCAGILNFLIPLVASGRLNLTICGLDAARLASFSLTLPPDLDLELIDLSRHDDASRGSRCDLALIHVLRERDDLEGLVEGIGRLMTEGGAAAIAQPLPDPLIDFYLGSQAGWFARSTLPTCPIGLVPSTAETLRRIAQTGWHDLRHATDPSGPGQVILMRPPGQTSAVPIVLIEAMDAFSEFAVRLQAQLGTADDMSTEATASKKVAPHRSEQLCIIDGGVGMPRERVERSIAHALGVLRVEAANSRLWLVTRGAFDPDGDPAAAALWTFGRVLLNETPDREIRLVDLSPALAADEAVRELCALIRNCDREREVRITPLGKLVHRVMPAKSHLSEGEPKALRLADPRQRAVGSFVWEKVGRRAPGRQEIEVEVMAAGLNFRDVMLAMGLLNDDVLDSGAAGAVFGFECAGKIVALGDGVKNFKLGDSVFGFAPHAFATHVTAPCAGFAQLPDSFSIEAAAAVPVAFLTAWYSLVKLARLKAGETVLIHGGAGGVGLAAIQIAKARKARVIATVSSPDKAALTQLYGADAVHNSRSLAFVDAVLADGGADVVLNSLSGDAMRASIKCLKPFGRFVELGKRDYVANTELGLRPFRRNLSYFGVDIDQLFSHDSSILREGLKHITKGFADNQLVPLPYRLFGAEEMGDAFRLMQGSGHVGKIVLRPPHLTASSPTSSEDNRNSGCCAPSAFDPSRGVQLVIGGTGGFGFATAVWLAEQGARRIVVASRRGLLGPETTAGAERIAALGAELHVKTLDVTDADQVDAFVTDVATDLGPISGVYLTAMVLDDGFASGLDDPRISRVLAPKIDGAVNLDRSTRSQPVEQFVLYSSATTLIGNPGQAAYAAANGFLHGLARRRRSEGLPALTVAWGAISDTGVLARTAATAGSLERLTGLAGMPAAEALSALGAALRAVDQHADPVVYCTHFKTQGAMLDLPILSSPAFSALTKHASPSARTADTDIASLIKGKQAEEAIEILSSLVAGEIAAILRQSVADVDVDRPLDELGLDSLMALELRMSVESKFGVELPLVAITSVRNIRDLAKRMLATMPGEDTTQSPPPNRTEETLYYMHGGDESALNSSQETKHSRENQVSEI